MCSRSMLVTTDRIGESLRNDRSLSSASATRYCDLPRRAFDPMASTRPPTTTVGSSPPAARTAATIDVVVVLFFFSSRRRHTRLQGDWSSDVCSSDLLRDGPLGRPLDGPRLACSF